MATLTEWNKFLASAPESEQEFRCIEFYHSYFTSVVRIVNKFTDKYFTLEDTAPRNPNESVKFDSLFLKVEEPEENKDGESALNINLGGIGNLVQDQLDLIDGDGFLEQIQCIYRKYYSGDLSEPVKVLYLDVSSVIFAGYESVKMIAEDSDLINKNSGERYTLSRFPQLKST